MKNTGLGLMGRRAILALALSAVIAAPAMAQRPTIRRVLMTTVKADRVGDFEAAVRDYNEALKKIPGARNQGQFQSLSGPNQFLLVRDYEKWEDLDGGAVNDAMQANPQLSRISARIYACIESSTMVVQELQPELSTATTPSEQIQLLRIARTRILPGKRKEWEAMVKNELLPAYMKAGYGSFTVRRVRFGAPGNEYWDTLRMAKWADAGTNKLQKSMGQAAYDSLNDRLGALTESRELNVYRFRQDLSFSAQK